MQVLTTERLRLRPFEQNDWAVLCRLFADPDVMQFSDGRRSPDWVQNWLEERITEAADAPSGSWAVTLLADNRLLGYCGLSRYSDINSRPEIELGYRLLPEFWGQGYATEATQCVRDYAASALQLKRLISLIDPNNERSIRVAEKLGMVHEADVLLPGYDYSDRVYATELQ